MCIGGGNRSQPATPAPAPAPPPPAPIAEETEVASARKAEDKAVFGSDRPSTRVDRSLSSGGVGAGGTGIRM